MGVFLF